MRGQAGFGVWITGLPASGKSTIARELVKRLNELGVPVVTLESDEMRKILTPEPTYRLGERDQFYRALALIGERIIASGVNVIFDATAGKRAYRDHARGLISRFLEVYVDCPLDICMRRDPKGIYASATSGRAVTVPGIQIPYEPPVKPELTVSGEAGPETGVDRIIDKLEQLQFI